MRSGKIACLARLNSAFPVRAGLSPEPAFCLRCVCTARFDVIFSGHEFAAIRFGARSSPASARGETTPVPLRSNPLARLPAGPASLQTARCPRPCWPLLTMTRLRTAAFFTKACLRHGFWSRQGNRSRKRPAFTTSRKHGGLFFSGTRFRRPFGGGRVYR